MLNEAYYDVGKLNSPTLSLSVQKKKIWAYFLHKGRIDLILDDNSTSSSLSYP